MFSAGIFFIIWGLLFAGIPLIGIFTIIAQGENHAPIPFILIFVVIGTIVFCVGIRNFIKAYKINKLKTNGTSGKGYFICSGVGMKVNDIPKYYIKFSYKNESGELKEIKTFSTYSYDEVMFYESIKSFDIKYNKNNAVIVEPVDPTKIKQAFNNTTPQVQEAPTTYYKCEYCGNVQEKPGKCKCCGAKIDKKLK